MGWFGQDDDSYAQAHAEVVNAPHKAELSHELIAAAASYEAAKAYEKHAAAQGKIQDHQEFKAFGAAAVGAFVDRIAETKGLDFVDRERAKHQAKKQFEGAF